MLKIKNKLFQPVQIGIRSDDHHSLETVTIGARAEIQIEEDLTTPMIDCLEKRGWIKISKVL